MDVFQGFNTYAENINEDDFIRDSLIQDAVIRNLEVIGEAVKKLDNDFRSEHSQIPWKNIAGMRDKLIHDYIGVDILAVWGVIKEVIPNFEKQIKEIADRLSK